MINRIGRIGLSRPLRTGADSLADYWASLVSAAIEDATPSYLELTFPEAGSLTKDDFSVSVDGVARTINSAIWSGAKITLVLASVVDYLADIRVACRSYQSVEVANNILYRWTLDSRGDGVATLRLEVNDVITCTLSGSARFYTNIGGTEGESTTWILQAGEVRTIFLKCTSGSSTITFSDGSKLIRWGGGSLGWYSVENAPKVTANVSKLSLLRMTVYDNATIVGALSSTLTFISFTGDNFSWTHTGALPSGATTIMFDSEGVDWTYSGPLSAKLERLVFNSSKVKWSYDGSLSNELTSLLLLGDKINWTGLSVGGADMTTLMLYKYRTTKMSSADMITFLEHLTNRTGSLPATVTIGDYVDADSPPAEVTAAAATLRATKSISTLNIWG